MMRNGWKNVINCDEYKYNNVNFILLSLNMTQTVFFFFFRFQEIHPVYSPHSSFRKQIFISLWIYFLLSLLLIPVASLPFVIMNIASQPYQRGIFCQDESIGYPIRPDTITHVTLAAVTITCTIIIVSPSFIHLHHPSHDLIIPRVTCWSSTKCPFMTLHRRGFDYAQQHSIFCSWTCLTHLWQT